MDLEKIGSYLKHLRLEKGITQEQLAEHFAVSSRSVSRWETGKTLADLSVIIELADFYKVDLRELLDGGTKPLTKKEVQDTPEKMAAYSNEEKLMLTVRLRIFSVVGLIALIIQFILEVLELEPTHLVETIRSMTSGIASGTLLLAVIYRTSALWELQGKKKRLVKKI